MTETPQPDMSVPAAVAWIALAVVLSPILLPLLAFAWVGRKLGYETAWELLLAVGNVKR